jgi:hypothetical protein
MRDVDDVEHAERDRDADRHRDVEAAKQNAGDDRVDQQFDGEVHGSILPGGLRPGALRHACDPCSP